MPNAALPRPGLLRFLLAGGEGLIELDDDQRLSAFVEKPDSPPEVGCVNAGLYVVSPAVLDYVRPGFDLGHDVWPRMLAAGEPLYGYLPDGYFRDVGSPDALERASADITGGAVRW
jgi:mannose-1-phosphate guanylyltransferase/phosphomannomutase